MGNCLNLPTFHGPSFQANNRGQDLPNNRRYNQDVYVKNANINNDVNGLQAVNFYQDVKLDQLRFSQDVDLDQIRSAPAVDLDSTTPALDVDLNQMKTAPTVELSGISIQEHTIHGKMHGQKGFRMPKFGFGLGNPPSYQDAIDQNFQNGSHIAKGNEQRFSTTQRGFGFKLPKHTRGKSRNKTHTIVGIGGGPHSHRTGHSHNKRGFGVRGPSFR
uniref:Uncharacterized protein n=1 Tax=Clytia hemisphaerica TaxID=252671 RepID=A0A7M5VAD6_9CNID|eukprot:TCONS_00008080-protein